MLGHALALAFRGLSIYRWNNYPRVENVTATDNLSFSIHVAYFLARLYEERHGVKVDVGYMLRRALVTAFPTFVHSDISNEFKAHVKRKDPAIYDAIADVVYDRLERWNLPDFLLKDVAEYRKPNPGKALEERIYTFAKNWVSCQEASVNNFVYFRAYDRPLEDIRARYLSDEFSELREFLALDPADFGDNERYLMAIRRLQSAFRWNRNRRIHPVSVMSHLYFIFFLSYCIGNFEGLSNEAVTDMMLTALFHDIPEAITGDIITPTKKSVAGFEELIVEIEEEMVDEHLVSYIKGRSFAAEFKTRMLDPWGMENGPLVKLADHFSALFEATIEAHHNSEFAEVKRNIRRNLQSMRKPSADLLFREASDSFEDNLEEVLR